MKYDCELIQDIFPLYKDNVLSDKSKEIIKEHLAECEICGRIYEQGITEQSTNLIEQDNISENSNIKSYSKRIKRVRILIVSGILLFMLLVSASVFTYSKFDTFNPFSTAIGIVRITATDTDYVQIQSHPRVIIAKPDNANQMFRDFVKSEGYSIIDQLGGKYVLEKDGIREYVFFSANKYYSLWSWKYT